MGRRLDPIEVLEAAYSLEGDERQWLERVLGAASPGIDQGLGAVAFTTTLPRMVEGRFDALASTLRVGDPLPMLKEINASATPETVALLTRRAWIFGSTSELIAPIRRDEPHAFERAAAPYGIADSIGLFAQDGEGGILDIAAPAAKRVRVHAKQRELWSRLAAHLTAMLRLRRRVHRTEAAVLTPSGRVAHASDDAKSTAVREALVAAVKRRERARGPLRRDDPERALAVWQGLVDGRWSLVDRFEVDGSRWIVAYPNAPEVRDPRKLTSLEQQVVRYAARGAANKEIAYAFGVSTSTVAEAVARACKKLRVRGRSELAAMGSFRTAEAVELDGLEIDVIVERSRDASALPGALTAAERELADQVARGASDAAIAAARGTSRRTVSNQLARLYRKLGVHNRTELTAKLARALSTR